MALRGALLMTVVLLAGCATGPVVPDDAATGDDAALPGLELHAWAEERDGSTLLHGVLLNNGSTSFQYRAECGHPWTSGVHGADGEPVRLYVKDLCADFFYDVLRPGQHLEFRHSWDHADHPADDPRGIPVAPGDYTWRLRATLIGPHPGDLVVEVPVQVADDGWTVVRDEAWPGLVLHARVDPHQEGHRLVAHLGNEGDAPVVHLTRCGAPWHEQITAPEGDVFTGHDGGSCDAIDQGRAGPGEQDSLVLAWDGRLPGTEGARTPAGPGQYVWNATFRLGDPFEEGHEGSLTAAVPFTVG